MGAVTKEQLEQVRREAAEIGKRGKVEMVAVRAVHDDGVYTGGVRYAKGDTLKMEIQLVPAHVAAGQVEVVTKASPAKKD